MNNYQQRESYRKYLLKNKREIKMTQFAWYIPRIDVIVIQTINKDCVIDFWWGFEDAAEHCFVDLEDELMLPLGEL